MKLDRYTIGALAGAAALTVGVSAVLAAPRATTNRTARCEALITRIAERRGISVEQLRANVEARLLTRIEAAEKSGRISQDRAAALRQRVSEGSPCRARKIARIAIAGRSMLRAAADFLGLERAELRERLPGNSLAGLAQKQGKSVDALTAAMVAPARQRLTKAVAAGLITQAQADAAHAKLAALASRLASKVFPQP